MPMAGGSQGSSASQHPFRLSGLMESRGTLDRMHHALYVVCRKRGQRKASPTAAIIESQSAKSAEKTGLASIPMGMTQARKSKAKTAYSWRYAGFAAPRDDRSGRRSGPRWRHLACVDAVPHDVSGQIFKSSRPQLGDSIVIRSD